ncbi:MAG: hypothetical protein WCS52_03655 [bacterium]
MKSEFNNLLKSWAARHTPPVEHLERLSNQIAVNTAQTRYLAHQADVSSVASLWGKALYTLAGALIAVLGIAIWAGRSQAPVPEGFGVTGIAQLVTPSSSQVDAIRKLFAETSRLFPKQLRWITQSNGEVGLGVEQDDNSPVPDTPAMLVRLVMVTRVRGEKTWRRAWSTDVVIRGEDLVEVTPSRQSNNKLTLWVYPLADGKVAVDTSIMLEKPTVISSRFDTVIGMGEPVEVSYSRVGNEETKVFQTVEALCRVKGRKS